MSIPNALVLLALGILGCAIWALFWAIDDGYDDLEQHANAAPDEEGTGLFLVEAKTEPRPVRADQK